MAEGIRFKCSDCGKTIDAWSDGNPYYIDSHGKKEYAHHPDHKNLARCIGNDSPHLCLRCGEEFLVDSREPISTCPKCGSKDISDAYRLDGRTCPFCNQGAFQLDPTYHAIS